MRLSRKTTRCIAGALAVAFAGCTDSNLYEPIPHDVPELDRAVTVRGQFCTDPANSVIQPVKIVLAMDTTLSMAVSDPNGDRATAMVDLLNNLPQNDPEIYIAVLLFAGFTPVWLTNGGLPGFTQLVTMSQTDIQVLEGKVLAYGYPGNTANRGGTDFVKPLDEIYAAISQDISEASASAGFTDAGNGYQPIRARYTVIFLSDGGPPSNPEDNDIFARVMSIRSLAFESADCTLNTVRVFEPTEPADVICNPDSDSGCEQILESNIARMQTMANLGGGQFRDFENHEPINFLVFNFGTSKRRYIMDRMTLYNLNAMARSPVTEPDSDGDGIPDTLEVDGGTDTDPRLVDSIGDGFSDGVKYYFQQHGADVTLVPYADGGGNPGCIQALYHVDTDGDGLWDCDELLLGTNADAVDSDGDGVPDLIEWLGGTQPTVPDMENDPDSDSLLNAAELRMHTDPNSADIENLSEVAYRYTIETSPPQADGGGAVGTASSNVTSPLSNTTVETPTELTDGSTCYNFEIDNVLLVPTLDVGAGPGINNLMLAISVVPADDTTAQPITHLAHLSARYPIDGIKGPPDGILPVTTADFARYLQ